jgi:hypothetical protein
MHEGRRERRLLLASYAPRSSSMCVRLWLVMICHANWSKIYYIDQSSWTTWRQKSLSLSRNLSDDENKTNDTFSLRSQLKSKPMITTLRCRREHTNKDLSDTCDEEGSFSGRARNNAECEDSYIYVL